MDNAVTPSRINMRAQKSEKIALTKPYPSCMLFESLGRSQLDFVLCQILDNGSRDLIRMNKTQGSLVCGGSKKKRIQTRMSIRLPLTLTAALRSFSDMPFLEALLLAEGCGIGEVKANGVCSTGVLVLEGAAVEYIGIDIACVGGICPAS